MKWLDRLERKYGRYAIKNLMLYIVILNAVVYVLMMIPGTNLINKFILDPQLVLKGETWRLVTLYYPPKCFSYIYHICIIFLLYDWQQFRE